MSYYRDAPGYGTQQFTFAPPPQPEFRPEPGWGGRDYYNAAAISPDMSLYDTALSRVRSGAQGVGFHEARHWHRRAYGGLVDLSQIAPNELGAAAGYEAYRSWIHNSSMYEPLMPDDERQREAMVALAVAEVTRLWHSSGRRLDRYGLQVASEAAAATASIIMGQWSESDFPGGGSTVGSAYGGQPQYEQYPPQQQYDQYANQSQFDPYAYDNAVYPRRSRHRRRRSSVAAPTILSGGGQPYYNSAASSVSMPAYNSGASAIGVPSYQVAQPAGSTILSQAYPTGASYGMPQSVPYQQQAVMPRGSIITGGIPQQTTMYQQPYGGAMPGQPMGNTIVIPPPERQRHRHRSRSRVRDEDREERRRRRERRYSDVGPTGLMGIGGLGGAGTFGGPLYPQYGAASVVGGAPYRY